MVDFDVVVAGSGGAGLTAALAAAAGGTRVLLAEASPYWGGATAVSGAHVWVPDNHHMSEAGVPDSFDDAFNYCTTLSPGRDEARIRAFLRAAPRMARFVEQHSDLRFSPCDWPDSFAESPGGRHAARHLEPMPLETGSADVLEEFWPHQYPPVLMNDEVFGSAVHIDGSQFPMGVAERRFAAGEVTLGVALSMALLRACRTAGVDARRDTRVTRLYQDGSGRITGVEVAGDSGRVEYSCRAVVLATGGFEWDPALTATLLSAPMTHPASPPANRGDGLRLAAEAGARLGAVGESWCWPVTYDGEADWGDEAASPKASLVLAERTLPHAIWVNAAGQRFVNEASHNCALAFGERNTATNLPRNVPAWAIGDAQFRARYSVGGVPPDDPLPNRVPQADDLAGLAKVAGIDADRLIATVTRFNEFAEAGIDRDFGRGVSAYDRRLGDPHAPHHSLGTIERPPFFALPIHPGAVGTKGGAYTDDRARVLDWHGGVIEGLYAAGNAAAAVFGPGTIAAGLTLGSALTWGWIAGMDAA